MVRLSLWGNSHQREGDMGNLGQSEWLIVSEDPFLPPTNGQALSSRGGLIAFCKIAKSNLIESTFAKCKTNWPWI